MRSLRCSALHAKTSERSESKAISTHHRSISVIDYEVRKLQKNRIHQSGDSAISNLYGLRRIARFFIFLDFNRIDRFEFLAVLIGIQLVCSRLASEARQTVAHVFF
jgi:hypothetical protein